MADAKFANSSITAEKIFYDVRVMFYMLLPSETYYEKANEVPDLAKNAINVFFSFVIIEQIISIAKHGRFAGRINDMATSVSAGLLSAVPNYFTRKLHYVTYAWIFDNHKIWDLSWDSIWTYLLTFLFIDMMYYWFHRASHELNVLWASHQTHHSSADYNFTTALRQSIFQSLYYWVFYFPLAFFVRPSIYMVHGHLNIIYMFWIHTEIVDSIGPLEYIFNTPSHHRVHHGRNPYCLDKNYGGVLIIWDRLFGTFAKEKPNEEIAYGLVHPVESFDPIYLQLFNYKYVFGEFFKAKTWSHKLNILFKGPGWQPGTPRLGNPDDVPEISYPVVKYDGKIVSFMNVYVGVQFAFAAILFANFAKQVEEIPTLTFSLGVIFGIYNLTCFGWIFDAKPNCLIYEGVRVLSLIVCSIYFSDPIKSYLFDVRLLYGVFWWLNVVSFGFVFLLWSCKISFKKETIDKKDD